MEVCYFALKKIDVGNRVAEVGDLIPEAAAWPFINGYVQEGTLAVCRVSSLYEDEQDALAEWERTSKFTLYDERNETMAQRDMRPTSAVSEDERIDGSDKAIEDEGLPEAEVVDDSSEATPEQVAQDERARGVAVDAGEDAEDADDEEVEDYGSWTVADLKAEADQRGVAHNSGATKADLVALLEQDDAS